jgi:hypothetical protein
MATVAFRIPATEVVILRGSIPVNMSHADGREANGESLLPVCTKLVEENGHSVADPRRPRA